MHNISILGTHSDSGKSTLTFIIAKIIQDFGYSVVPFKAQNVSNNAYVADDGCEISIAQHFQASVLNIETSYHLNPILLKSGASLIVEGEVCANKDINTLKPIVAKAYKFLQARYDCVVNEGAGSPVELNLMDKDLSNIYIADTFNTKIIIIADIEKGGVFASIYGVYNLLPKKLQNNVIGVIVNKFRGDMRLFDDGVAIIEQQFGIPVFGVLPFMPLNFGFEDSQSLSHYSQNLGKKKCDVAVIAYPHMSNFNDFEPLIADAEINLEFINHNVNLQRYDLIILPGSKLVYKDLQWLKKTGLAEQLKGVSNTIYGLCGGYEMLFKHIKDPYKIESEFGHDTDALGFIDDDINLEHIKILTKQHYSIFNQSVFGFEMHHGTSKKYPLWFSQNNISGSFVHAIFDNDNFRYSLFNDLNPDYKGFNFQQYKRKTIDHFIDTMKARINTDALIQAITH